MSFVGIFLQDFHSFSTFLHCRPLINFFPRLIFVRWSFSLRKKERYVVLRKMRNWTVDISYSIHTGYNGRKNELDISLISPVACQKKYLKTRDEILALADWELQTTPRTIGVNCSVSQSASRATLYQKTGNDKFLISVFRKQTLSYTQINVLVAH